VMGMVILEIKWIRFLHFTEDLGGFNTPHFFTSNSRLSQHVCALRLRLSECVL
jgi:hypothetical protein